MKTIGFYVTNSGFGHVTRTLAIIERLLEVSDCHIYYACGESQNEYAKAYLIHHLDRISFKVLNTEVGIVVEEDSFQVDIMETEKAIEGFLDETSELVEREAKALSDHNVALVVSDISIIGILAAKKAGIGVVGITNYTWYHRYMKLGINKDLVQPFLDSYNQLDCLYVYDYADEMPNITCPKKSVGLVARQVNHNTVGDIKSMYWPSCFISIGQVGGHEGIEVDFQAGHIFATGNVDITGNSHVMKLPKRIGHSQNYVAASSLAIVKPGWSMVAECLIDGIPFGVIDVSPIEDGEIIEKLVSKNRCFVLQEEDLKHIGVKELNMKAHDYSIVKEKNAAKDIALELIEQISV